jgi:RNA polymerase sigma-70 factor (ECF subfamily)
LRKTTAKRYGSDTEKIERGIGTHKYGNQPGFSRRKPSPRQRVRCHPLAGVKLHMAAVQGDATDEMLMVRYQRGERQAFAELLRRHSRPIYNFALRQLRVPSLAEEVTRDVFMRLVQNAAEFKHEARFLTWLYTIARNACVDQLRKLAHRQHISLDRAAGDGPDSVALAEAIADDSSRASTDRRALSAEVRSSIVKVVDALADDQREVFLLRQVANLPFRDIAEITGVGEHTVKSRMRYALDRLKDALREFEEYARALR